MMPNRPLVLIVEDEPALQALVAEVLAEELRVATRTASTAAAALTLMAQLHPALLVLDLTLPDSSGDVVGQLTRAALDGDIRILVCSAAGRTAEQLAEKATADAYLPKPFDLEDLLATVTRLLASEGDRVTVHEATD